MLVFVNVLNQTIKYLIYELGNNVQTLNLKKVREIKKMNSKFAFSMNFQSYIV